MLNTSYTHTHTHIYTCMKIYNRGNLMMQLKWKTGEAGYLEMNGTQYLLQQIHWHSPSEHTINGNKLALEAHLVHETPSGQIIVVGILYQFGQPDSFLSKVT